MWMGCTETPAHEILRDSRQYLESSLHRSASGGRKSTTCRFQLLPLLPPLQGCSGPISSGSENRWRRRSGTMPAALQPCDVCLVIGTSGVVYPAAGFASSAKEAGAFVAEINLDPTPHSGLVDVSLQGRAKDLVPLTTRASRSGNSSSRLRIVRTPFAVCCRLPVQLEHP